MVLMQIVMLVVVIIMIIIGTVFLVKYLKEQKNNYTKDVDIRNHNLDKMISIICLVGGLIIGICIPFVG